MSVSNRAELIFLQRLQSYLLLILIKEVNFFFHDFMYDYKHARF